MRDKNPSRLLRIPESLVLFGALALGALGGVQESISQDAAAPALRIAVVDMQETLNRYYRTEVEIEKINEIADEKSRSLDERQAAFQEDGNRGLELQRTMSDTSLAEAVRREAAEKLQVFARERQVRAAEIAAAQRKSAAELSQARSEIEATLVSEIRSALNEIAASRGYDLVFDKSFLPKASKSIIRVSEEVPDLTEDLVAALNAGSTE